MLGLSNEKRLDAQQSNPKWFVLIAASFKKGEQCASWCCFNEKPFWHGKPSATTVLCCELLTVSAGFNFLLYFLWRQLPTSLKVKIVSIFVQERMGITFIFFLFSPLLFSPCSVCQLKALDLCLEPTNAFVRLDSIIPKSFQWTAFTVSAFAWVWTRRSMNNARFLFILVRVM